MPALARWARSLTDLVIPTKFSLSANFMTGTIKFPSAKDVAIPIFIFFFTKILLLSTEIFIIGYVLRATETACIKIGVKVSFSPSLFSKSDLTLFLQFHTFVTSTSIKD